jgi:membrane peptidoglycan carboxypeptidase
MATAIRLGILVCANWLVSQSMCVAMRQIILDDEAPLSRRVESALLAGIDGQFLSREPDDTGLLLDVVGYELQRAVSKSRLRCGGDTMSMVLARALHPSASRSRRMLVARILERVLTRQDIVREVGRRAYFGGGRVGVDDAARRLFKKESAALSLAEAALLGGMVQAPTRFLSHEDSARVRTGYVLEQMRRLGRVTDGELAAALNDVDGVAARAVAAHNVRTTSSAQSPHKTLMSRARSPMAQR